MSRIKPNVLWLMSDQHNANCMGHAGHPDVRTPNLDRIAGLGTQFHHGYCNNPVCGPSRCSFLSGQHVKTHGVSGNFIRGVESEAPNLARLFRSHGYQTGLIGKAHLPWKWVQEGFEHIRLSDLCDADWDDPLSCHYFSDLVEAGLGDQYDQGRLPNDHPEYTKGWFISELPEEYSLESWTGRKAVEFLEQRDREKPFFLKVSFQRPHDPYAPPASCAHDYDPQKLTLPENACDYFERMFAGKPKHQRDYVAKEFGGYPFRFRNEGALSKALAAYYTLITMMDDAIGDILRTLDEQGELDNTIIAYVADHGDFAGEHGLMLKNLGIYGSIHRIPFLLAGPGVAPEIISEALIESVDLYPTIARLAGIEPEAGIDGTCRVGEYVAEPLEYTICDWDHHVEMTRAYAVRDKRWRFVHYDKFSNDGELYDCQNDPGELKNLFSNPEYREVVEQFQARVEAFRKNTVHTHAICDDGHAVQRVKEKPSLQLHQFMIKWSYLAGCFR